jgi:hypothetical protein
MPTNLDDVINKLGDRGVQDRYRSAVRAAAIRALADEGIVLTPEDWGTLMTRLIAARDAPVRPEFDWGKILSGAGAVVLPALASLF